jgi:regulator of RNase E activity RraB
MDFRALDAETIRQLEAAGGDLSRPFQVDHFIVELDADSAQFVAEELQGRGYTISIGRPQDGGDWGVQASHETMVNEETIAEIRREMTELAARFGGDYDGWGAAVN